MSFGRHLLVDGTNILHGWPEFRALLKRDRDAARSQLIQRLTTLHDTEAIRVTIVFDGRGSELVVERPFKQITFSVVYTSSSLTADDVIEQMVAKASAPTQCIVATDDRAERQTAAASGADIVSASDLAAWVARAESRRSTNVEARRAVNDRDWQKP